MRHAEAEFGRLGAGAEVLAPALRQRLPEAARGLGQPGRPA
jgi:hypothetical protein